MDSADEVLAMSFVNLAATAAYLSARMPAMVTLAAMAGPGDTGPGRQVVRHVPEKRAGGPAQQHGGHPGFLAQHPERRDFFGETAIVPETDYDLCLALDAFDFVLRARRGPEGFAELVALGSGAGGMAMDEQSRGVVEMKLSRARRGAWSERLDTEEGTLRGGGE
jgi:2-phosphosulfolactate phosphatase